MIKLGENNRAEVISIINENPTLNLFYMGDLNAYGFDEAICQYFGFFDEDKLSVLMLHYSDSFHVTGGELTTQQCQEIKEYIIENEIINLNFGKKHFKYLTELVTDYKDESCNLAVYTPNVEMDTTGCEKLTIVEASEYFDVYGKVFEFDRSEDKFINDIEEGNIEAYFIRENKDIVSVAAATAFTDKAAMIVGVGTLEKYRNKGYATKCVKALCNDLYQRNMQGVLFYNNPAAGRIYHRLGFVDQEPYHLIRINLHG